jgi:hypothetical protein
MRARPNSYLLTAFDNQLTLSKGIKNVRSIFADPRPALSNQPARRTKEKLITPSSGRISRLGLLYMRRKPWPVAASQKEKEIPESG